MVDCKRELGRAIRHFWTTRKNQRKNQGRRGVKDAGTRADVTGGKHTDGFVRLLGLIIEDAGVEGACIHAVSKKKRTLPGFYRPGKEWDLLVTSGSDIVAAVEIKSQVGSFGNNFNNRVEEAIGNGVDFWTAYRDGVFKPSAKPWVGYLFMLEEDPKSMRPCKHVKLPHYSVLPEFQGLSYAQRYGIACEKLVRERLYDAACLVTSNSVQGSKGIYSEPSAELTIEKFAISLHSRASAFAKMRQLSLPTKSR